MKMHTILDKLEPLLLLNMRQRMHRLIALFAGVTIGVGYLFVLPVYDDVTALNEQITQTVRMLETRRAMAADLPRKREEFAELERKLQFALAVLPKKSQIPDLLEQVSWSVKDAGLELLSFQPGDEQMDALYAKVPVRFAVRGTYRQLLLFLRSVGELPRIVLVSDLKLEQKPKDTLLSMHGLVTTYRFVEPDEGKKKDK